MRQAHTRCAYTHTILIHTHDADKACMRFLALCMYIHDAYTHTHDTHTYT